MPDWLWQALVVNGLWEWFLLPAVAIVVAVIKKKYPEFASYLISGLVAAACVTTFIIGARITAAIDRMPKTLPPFTATSLEKNIIDWLIGQKLNVQKIEEPGTLFRIDVHPPTNPITVSIEYQKPNDNYLIIGAGLSPDPKYKAAYEKLPEASKEELRDSVSLELARAKMEFNVDLHAHVSTFMALPITSNLNENAVIQSVGDVSDAIVVARHTFVLNLIRLQKTKP
jgi:hypothetical protein